MKKLYILSFILVSMILADCSSGKKSYTTGNYYDSVLKAVNRLRKNPNHKKSIQTLRNAYPLAVKYFEDQGRNMIASNDSYKWRAVVNSYTKINHLYEEINRSPGALKVIPNPVNNYADLEDARQNAAEESYVMGIKALSNGTREDAKQAFNFFKDADSFVKGYKDVVKKMEESIWAATLKVVVEPIPVAARNLEVSSEFFENKFYEYLHTQRINEFVKFYTIDEAKTINLNADHIISLSFDQFTVGQVYLKEKEKPVSRDSVVVAEIDRSQSTSTSQQPTEQKVTICHISPGNQKSQTLSVGTSALQAHINHGDTIGPCDGDPDPKANTNTVNSSNTKQSQKEKIYATVNATIYIYTKTITSNGVLDFRIIDAITGSVISQDKLPGEFIWQSEWATYNGDSRALTDEQIRLTRQKEAAPPSSQGLFIEFTRPIYDQMIGKVRNYYSGI